MPLKLIVALLIAGAMLATGLYVRNLQSSLSTARNTISSLNEQLRTTKEKLIEVTEDKTELDERLQFAAKEQVRIQSNLRSTLAKLRQQKPPTECKDAIDWAVERKGDLDW